MGPPRLRSTMAILVLVTPIALLALLALPAVTLADEPPCSSLYPSAGPGGVDLEKACAANEIVKNYTETTSSTPDILWTAILVLGAGWIAAVLVYAAWGYVAGRAARRVAPVTPTTYWLCESCRSFNGVEAMSCYKCHRRRTDGAPLVEAAETPPWDQRFGRPFDS